MIGDDYHCHCEMPRIRSAPSMGLLGGTTGAIPMKPIAFASFHSAPSEAFRAMQRFVIAPRSRPTARSGPLERRRVALARIADVALIAGVALSSAACTITADEYTPKAFEPDEDAAPTDDEAESAEPDADDEADAVLPSAPLTSGASDEAGPSGSVPLTNGAAIDADAAALPSGAALDDAESSPEGASDGAGQPAPALVLPALSPLMGWANVAGLGLETTSGGGAHTPVVARTADELVAFASSPEPLTIAVAGTIEVPALTLSSNKTLIGIGSDATLRGGIAIRGSADAFVQNVIVANLSIAA
ncbi:MAG TPA: hypothetical protein VMG12_05410, partial [Polyangiaceae bacterium]|nr:hypothetical protein [Polyangiaceae bacterium]